MFGLSFLYPLFLIGAAAVAIPIALHLFRRRTERVVEFPAVRLLHKAPVEQQRRRRLRELILLALRVSALALLALAFARPYFADATAARALPTTVVALDTSLSLSAPGRFETAREAARQAIAQAPATHSVALVTFADTATLVVAPTTDRAAVGEALAAVSPGAGGTRYRTALARAAETITSGAGTIVVVSDLQQVGWEAGDEGAVPDGVDVETRVVAPPDGNLAVTSARRAGPAVVASVHNFGSRPARAAVRLRVDGREVATATVAVAPQAAAEARLAAALPPRGAAAVDVDDPDGFQGDNTRHLVLDPPAAVPITVVTAEPPGTSTAGLYVERALEVAEDGEGFDVTILDGRTLSARPADAPEPGALILLGTRTLDRAGREQIAAFLRGGGQVLLALGPEIDLPSLADTLGTRVDVRPDVVEATGRSVTLVAVDSRHPIFRPFSRPTGALGDVRIDRYRHLSDEQTRLVLARFSDAGSALTEEAVGAGRLLIFASDLDNRWNRFPLNPAFVPWMIETARYLTRQHGLRQSYTVPDVPPGVPAVPGVHAVDARSVAVNPDLRESNPAPLSAEAFAAAITRQMPSAAAEARVLATEQEERQRLWQIGLAIMFLALASEGLIGRKAI